MENKLLAANLPLSLGSAQMDHPEDERSASAVTSPVEQKNRGNMQHLKDALSWLNATRDE